MHGVVTIGDCIVDEIRAEGKDPERFAGGAGLNLAAGIARLGLSSTLVTRVGQDRDGYYLLRYARERGIRIVNTPTVDPTGVVSSTRLNGEPSYAFAPAMYRRRIAFGAEALHALSNAAAAVVNSYPLDNPSHAGDLARAFSAAPGLRIADPNPRPRLISSLPAYREGFEKVLPVTNLAKLSDEDVHLLYGTNWRSVAEHLFGMGVETVLFSHGAGGATLVDRSGLQVAVPISGRPDPIVDTMGAGDATLASLVVSLLHGGRPSGADVWRRYLVQAMTVAAATCRRAGAELVAP